MNSIKYIVFLFTLTLYSQNTVTLGTHTKTILEVDQLVEIDNFNTSYFIKDNALIKDMGEESYSFSKIQFNEITSAHIFNPLKIIVFYKSFNSALILDNRLAEISSIDFNTLNPFRAVTHVSTGNDNTVWVYNENTQQIELFDYKSNKSRLYTLPNEGEVLDLKSNFNYCWLLTSKYIYVYNYVGSLINRFPNNGYAKMDENNGNLFLLKANKMYYKLNNSSEIKPLEIPKLLINQFFVTNETLYIYDEEVLHKFQLKIN